MTSLLFFSFFSIIITVSFDNSSGRWDGLFCSVLFFLLFLGQDFWSGWGAQGVLGWWSSSFFFSALSVYDETVDAFYAGACVC
jgi:hypothetical protein